MKFQDFEKRDDLCHKGQSRLLCAKNVGAIIKVGKNWYASHDPSWELVGIRPNHELLQPTVGPCKSAQDAYAAFARASGETRDPAETHEH